MTHIERRTFLKVGLLAPLATQFVGCGQAPNDGNKQQVDQQNKDMPGSEAMSSEQAATVTPFLMFVGKAKEAMDFYVGLFDDAKLLSIKQYGPNEAGQEGTVQLATFSLAGQKIMCIDSLVKHAFTFTPSISFFVTCPDEQKLRHYYKSLSEGGKVFMELGEYPFSKLFGWVADRFGVSWQLSVS